MTPDDLEEMTRETDDTVDFAALGKIALFCLLLIVLCAFAASARAECTCDTKPLLDGKPLCPPNTYDGKPKEEKFDRWKHPMTSAPISAGTIFVANGSGLLSAALPDPADVERAFNRHLLTHQESADFRWALEVLLLELPEGKQREHARDIFRKFRKHYEESPAQFLP